jgi:putative ABC transport system permease protein
MSVRLWLRDLLQRDRLDQELDDELKDHLDRDTERNIAQGMAPDEARRAALRAFGQLQRTRESVRSEWLGQLFESILRDVHFACRLLLRNPTFAVIATATLAIGIGANTAIFSLVYATLLRPLPYGNHRLIAFTTNQSLPDVSDIGRASKTMEHLGAYADMPFEIEEQGKPVEVKGAVVGGDVFSALNVNPSIGRTFGTNEGEARTPVAVVSHNFWISRFNSDPQVLGRKLTLSGTIYNVIGVMPENFVLPRSQSDVWLPVEVGYPEAVDARGAHFTFGIGVLRPGVTLEQARAELKTVGAELARLHPDEARSYNVAPLRDRLVGAVRTPLLVLFAAVSIVLLIACVNFSNLLLSRMAARQRELQARLALGASRGRIVRQIMTESLVIATIGALAGLTVAIIVLRLLLTMKPEDVRGLSTDAFSPATFAFALALAVVCGVVFGIAPAVQFLKTKASFREAPRTSTVRQARRSILVGVECALAVVLLCGAGLLIRSFWKLVSVEPGFNPRGLLTMRINLPVGRYQKIPSQVEFFKKLDRELQSVPEVESAGEVSELPLIGMHMEHNFVIKGRPDIPEGQEPELSAHEASPHYLATMQIPLLAGRTFDDNDTPESQPVAIITRSMAEQYFKGENPLGQQVAWARAPHKVWITIVGVVGDVRHDGLDYYALPALYTPLTQKQMAWKRFASIVVRTRAEDPMLASNAVQAAVMRADAQLPVTFVEPMTTVIAESLAERRFTLVLLSAFAAVALLLALIGVYGVISYLVEQRTHEIGVRMALGAQRSRVIVMVMSQGLSFAAIGVLVGALSGLWLLRLGRSMLFGVTATDPLAFGGAVVMLLLVAAIACFFPAKRASGIDPVQALRTE